MAFLDRIRSLFVPPADRRMQEAAALAFEKAPAPSVLLAAASAPFSGERQPPAATQKINWSSNSPAAPTSFAFQPGYSDHTFQDLSGPLAFEEFPIERIRAVCAAHRVGWFYGTSTLMVAILGFAPVLAALQQAIAPILALPRHVHGGDKGLAKMIAAEVEEQLVPSHGLLPSPYLPPETWGTMAIYVRMMGFCVLQHVDGQPDPDTGIRPRYTRVWEPWAVSKTRSPRRWLAYTTEGVIEIKNDGKFTLIMDENEGDLSASILALGEEALGGKLTQRQRLDWQDFFASPKLYATLPEKTATGGQVGDAFRYAVDSIYGPDGRGILPYGSTLQAVTYGSGQGASQFQDAILDCIIHIFMVLTGSAGTIGSGGPTGAGPYQPQKGGAWSVRHDLIARPTIAIVRALNGYHVAPYCEFNYGDAIRRAQRAGTWVWPTLVIPLPQPDRDERIKSVIERELARTNILESRRKVGIRIDQPEIDKVADDLELRHVSLVESTPQKGAISEKDMESKQFATDEYRASKGYDPLPNGAGSLDRLAEERAQGLDKIGATKVSEDEGGASANPSAPDPETTTGPMARSWSSSHARLDIHQGVGIELSQHSVKFDMAKSRAVMLRDGFACAYCGHKDEKQVGENLTIDHIKSRSTGGASQNGKRSGATNLITSCGSCNFSKGGKTNAQYNAFRKAAGKPEVDFKDIRAKAKKKVNIPKGEELAAHARAYQAASPKQQATWKPLYPSNGGGAAPPAAPAAPSGGGKGDSAGDEHHPPGTPHP